MSSMYKIHVDPEGLLVWRGALVTAEEGALFHQMQGFNKLLKGGEKMRRAFIRRFCYVMFVNNKPIMHCWGRACHATGGKRIEPHIYHAFARMTARDPIGRATMEQLARAYNKHRDHVIANKIAHFGKTR
ncbi:MAG: hypothetical protein ACRC47_03265 [Shewanella sp.]